MWEALQEEDVELILPTATASPQPVVMVFEGRCVEGRQMYWESQEEQGGMNSS